MPVASTPTGPGTASDVYFGILVLEQVTVVNVALSNRRFQMQLGLVGDGLVMDYVAW